MVGLLTPVKDADVSQEALENVDLEAPQEWLTEVAAADLVAALGEYHKVLSGLRAARQVGDHLRAEQLLKSEAYLRTLVAYLQYKYPAAKAIAKQQMALQAKQLAANRDKLDGA